jgi:hypothetical protein
LRNNDLSSEPVPRIAIVLEGALAWPPDDARKMKSFHRLLKRGRYEDAADLLEFNQRMETVIWDRAWRLSMTIDVVTFLGPDEWAVACARRIGDEELPVHKVWATTPQLLGRSLSFTPDLVRVYDPYPEHQLMYGTKGRYIKNANQLGY